mmetsp:Transcript_23613/g.48368  ORF Transcript_23613/g.48368 Transcript_23613/m.48368 type:complete len:250 (+) Transcript_23613:524-1273(+)
MMIMTMTMTMTTHHPHRSVASQVLLALATVFLLASSLHAFAPQERTRTRTRARIPTSISSITSSSTSTCLHSSATPSSPPPPQKPDLVGQTVFKAAIDRIQDEIEAQYANVNSPEAEQWLADRARAKQEDQQYVFLVGKLDVDLPIDTQPELDLTESIGPLVLVSNVWGRTAEATGMQSFDTITKVSVGGSADATELASFEYKTKETSLQETAGALTAAAQHAISIGKTEIQLEVQRLIKGYYAPEDSI